MGGLVVKKKKICSQLVVFLSNCNQKIAMSVLCGLLYISPGACIGHGLTTSKSYCWTGNFIDSLLTTMKEANGWNWGKNNIIMLKSVWGSAFFHIIYLQNCTVIQFLVVCDMNYDW